MGNKFFWVYMAVVRLIFRFCVGNHPMGVRFVARNHPTAVRFVARNHPSVCVADSSPQRGATANIRWRYWRPLRGDSPRGGEMSRSDRGDGALFELSPKVTEGWFPVQSLRQHRTIPA